MDGMTDDAKTTAQLREELKTLRAEFQQYRAHAAASSPQEAETALRNSEVQYRSLFESLQDVFFRTDRQGNIILVSPSIIQHLGYTQEDACALNMERDILADPRSWKQILTMVEENRYREAVEVQLTRWDRSVMWGSATAQWYTDAQGHILGVEGIMRDITRRKQAEERLRRNEEKYRIIVENIPDGFLLHDFQGTILEVNRNFCHMYGYTAADIIGKNLRAITPARIFTRQEQEIRALKQQDSRLFDSVGKRKDGTCFPINISMQVISDKQAGTIQSFVRDISERKHAEKLLTLNKQRLEALVHLQHHMHDSSIEDIVEYALEKAVELTGSSVALLNYVSTEDSVLTPSTWSKGVLKISDPPHAEYFAVKNTPVWDEVLADPTAHIMNDYTATHGDHFLDGYADLQRVLIVPVYHEDELVLLSAAANKEAVYDDADRHELTLLMGGMWNHIKARMASDELQQANEQLRELNADKDTFFSIIAHDLRGPLGSLHELTQHIEENLNSYVLEELKELIVLQKVSAETLYKLLENLLTWSRVQRGVMPFQPQPINIRWFIARNVELLTLHAQKKQITLTNTAEQKIFVLADFNMVDTIIRNLMSNAIKFTEPGGEVSISVDEQERFVEVSVADTGIGIEEQYIPTLFRIDTRYKRLGTADEEGSGLGLILCQEFVDKHQGGIRVESRVGAGTTFRFTLPKMSDEERAARREPVLPDMML